MKVAIIDALGSASGVRHSSKDAVGSGPRRVAGVLEARGLEAEILSAESVLNKPSLVTGFDVLMVSAMTIDEEAVQKIIKLWRHRNKDRPAIIGGPITGRPESLLDYGFDVAVVGEGETSILKLLDSVLKNGMLAGSRKKIMIGGVLYENDARVLADLINREDYHRRHLHELDVLSSFSSSVNCVRDYPVYNALKFYVEIARGCSNYLRTSIPLPDGRRCTGCQICRNGEMEERIQCPANVPPGCGFCSVPSIFGPSRSRHERKILTEVRDLVKTGVRRIALSASDFLDYKRDELVGHRLLTDPSFPPPNNDGIESLLSKLVSIQKTINIPEKDYVYFSVENVKPCLFNDEVASIIAEYLPGSTIHLGCETGSEEHSLKLGRPSSPAQTLEAVRTATKHRLRPYIYFIHGLPGQTAQTARETVRAMIDMANAGAEKITLYRFKPLPLSAFEMFPPAPPAKRNRDSKMIEETARRLNIESKKRILGKTIDVITFKHVSGGGRDGMIAYPVSDGPVVLLHEKDVKQGMRLKIKITELLSDRLVKGCIL